METDERDDLETGETEARTGRDDLYAAMPETGGGDTTMAAGPASGAAGVANAELGTSGRPASQLLTPEELAAAEAAGGGGLAPERLDDGRLEEYLGEESSDSSR